MGHRLSLMASSSSTVRVEQLVSGGIYFEAIHDIRTLGHTGWVPHGVWHRRVAHPPRVVTRSPGLHIGVRGTARIPWHHPTATRPEVDSPRWFRPTPTALGRLERGPMYDVTTQKS